MGHLQASFSIYYCVVFSEFLSYCLVQEIQPNPIAGMKGNNSIVSEIVSMLSMCPCKNITYSFQYLQYDE